MAEFTDTDLEQAAQIAIRRHQLAEALATVKAIAEGSEQAAYAAGRAAQLAADIKLAEQHGAEYPDGDDGETCCDAECHFIWKPFADLLRGRA